MMNNKYIIPMLLALSSCSLAPEFTMPDLGLPDVFKNQETVIIEGQNGRWKEGQPMEVADRGEWWKIFNDERLNNLEEQAMASNQSLAAASARVTQSRAMVRSKASTFFPTIDLGANASRAKPSSAAASAFGAGGSDLPPYTLYSATATASYEVDVFGRVRDNEKAFAADADAQEATYKSIMLALQADVAQHYFYIRSLDAERELLRNTVDVRKEANRIMQKRFDLGESGEIDLTRTQSDLAAVQAELTALDRARAQVETSLAVLLGKLPSQFEFPEAPLADMPPKIPAGIPSALLERRPDISAAQSAMAAANARIGVAKTAYFPVLNLTASGGYESTELGDLFDWSSRVWSLGQLAGSALSVTLFDSGRIKAKVEVADAAYEESVANYREQVLRAFRDVEDSLSGQRLLAEQSDLQDVAAARASRTTELVQKRYKEGDVNYFEVVDAQRNSLAAERAAVQTRGQRFITTVNLVRALGGGWSE